MSCEHWSSQEPRRVYPMDRPKWKVTAPRNLEVFIRNLHRLLPEGSRLFLEGTVIDPEVKKYLILHQPPVCPAVELETIHSGPPQAFHLPVREDVLAGLADFARTWYEIYEATPGAKGQLPVPQLYDHLKAYIDENEIMVWYDAGDEVPWFVGAAIDEGRLREFCALVGCHVEPFCPAM